MKFTFNKIIRPCLVAIPLMTGGFAMDPAIPEKQGITTSSFSSFLNFFSSSIQSSSQSTSDALEDTSVSCFRASNVDTIVAQAMTPLDRTQHSFWLQDWGKSIQVTCLDGVKLAGHWAEKKTSTLTVILFHGNGMTSDSYQRWAQWFQNYGCNVLAVTIRGYPGSEGSSDFIKSASALDVEAVVRYALWDLSIPKEKLITYGFSLGGAYATYASRHFGIPVILQNTLTNVPDIIQNVSPIPLMECTRNAIARTHLDKAPILSSLDQLGLFMDKKRVPLNSFDNLDNLRATKAPVMIIYAENDGLMGKESRARELYEARYTTENPVDSDLFVGIPNGDHVSVFLDDKKAQTAVLKFMAKIFS